MNHKHTLAEDLFALFSGALAASLGIFLFAQVGMLAGGTTGAALLLTHVSAFSFGQLFFVINLPFYILAILRMGWRFTLNTFITVGVVSVLADNLHYVIELQSLNPLYAAVAGGLLIGLGILIMVRHNASLGGLNIFVFYLQERFGLRAGYVQLTIDMLLMVCGALLLPLEQIGYSVLGALVVNLTLAINHKPGRYQSWATTA